MAHVDVAGSLFASCQMTQVNNCKILDAVPGFIGEMKMTKIVN
jgi:hypothetical protein